MTARIILRDIGDEQRPPRAAARERAVSRPPLMRDDADAARVELPDGDVPGASASRG